MLFFWDPPLKGDLLAVDVARGIVQSLRGAYVRTLSVDEYTYVLRYVRTYSVRAYVMWWRVWGHTRTHFFRRPPFGASV